MNSYRAVTEAGKGRWFTAFVEGEHAGNLGVFVDAAGNGFFQEVVTHPSHRRKGICRSLTYYAARYAFEHIGAARLVVIAEQEGDAKGIYEQLGFTETERLVGMWG